jgi:hypothetical protein
MHAFFCSPIRLLPFLMTCMLLTACGGLLSSAGTDSIDSPAQRAASAAFAKVDNLDALPTTSMLSKMLYRDWLTKPVPRAFALSSDGAAYRTWGITTDPKVPLDVAERALHRCNKAGKKDCKLYAVDNTVVWPR